ncbi:MAG: LysR family transcriptional regulator [Candidatus Caccosoma sp.]|nr:LysR family transcriptional regulator [Candidatus Caccosoma sp.]
MLDDKIKTLITLAEVKNFTHAAKELSMTQPAVSNHIKLLEEELQAKLFIRKKNELILTEEGKIALNYAKKFIALYEKLKIDIKDQKENISSLRVGITHTSESNIMMTVLAKCSNELANTTITVITDTIKNLYSKLDNFEIDIAIVEEKANPLKYNSLLLDTDYLVCVLSKENHLSEKSMITINDLKKEKMILRLPDSATRIMFDSTLNTINESIDNFNVILEVDNIATIKDLVRKNLGVSILARSACLDEIKKDKLCAVTIENLSMIRETNIVYNKLFNYTNILQTIYKTYTEYNKSNK